MIKPCPATADQIRAAAQAIREGNLVAFGTETVYGLGGDATNSTAVAKIYAAKNRPAFNPLISHVATPSRAFEFGRENPMARQLAEAFWPGPMTLILERNDNHVDTKVCDLAMAGLDSIALRVPAKAEAQEFLIESGCPVAAPSANKSGRISPTRADHVMEELGDVADLAFILDMGPAENGLESTVIDARGDIPVILRPGAITPAMIKTATDSTPEFPQKPSKTDHGDIISPGQLSRHYAPTKPVILNSTDIHPGDIQIGFGTHDGDFNLSTSGNLTEAAANLYHIMRKADMMEGVRIIIAPIPEESLGIAINDRLRRAATPEG
jgi:L-threonylcarbamoyladenylate synthase